MSDASDSTAIPPGLEDPVPRDGFSEPLLLVFSRCLCCAQ